MSANNRSDLHSMHDGPLQVGQQLNGGRYTVQRPLAQGGMSTIYLATDHTAFERTVVVKVRDESLEGDDPEQFLAEARILAGLAYPLIPQMLAYFQDASRRCIVMEYIEGRNLQYRLTRIDERSGQPVPGQAFALADVVRWGVELCRVLEYLASRPSPVVHHDIKPANLVLETHSGALFLVDFGTAQAQLGHAHVASGSDASVYGTPGYAPPEQYRGACEPRSDVYALAATLYHLATDDDPSEHPFLFPQLERIGALGRVLAAALHNETQQRSLAVTLRQQLEQLQRHVQARDIIAPDGTTIAEASDLVSWCEHHHEAALGWLYGDPTTSPLADQLEQCWARADLARSIRARLAQYRAAPAAGLDAVLALVAPLSYGSLRPQLAANTALVDFGMIQESAPVERILTVSNIGRRFVRAQVQLPPWVAPLEQTATVALAPGEQLELRLAASMPFERSSTKLLRDTLVISDGAAALMQIQLEATTAPLSVIGTRAANSGQIVAQTGARARLHRASIRRLPVWFWWWLFVALLVFLVVILFINVIM